MNAITFHWNTPDIVPKEKYEPILCVTRNNKLCIFSYDPYKEIWKERCHWLRYRSFESVVRHYGIKYWAYQRAVIYDKEII